MGRTTAIQAPPESTAMSSRAAPSAAAERRFSRAATASATRAGWRESTTQPVSGTGAWAPRTSPPRRSRKRPAPCTRPERARATSTGGKASSDASRPSSRRPPGPPGAARASTASCPRSSGCSTSSSSEPSQTRRTAPAPEGRGAEIRTTGGLLPATIATGCGHGPASPAAARRRAASSLSCTRITVSPRALTTATASTPSEDQAWRLCTSSSWPCGERGSASPRFPARPRARASRVSRNAPTREAAVCAASEWVLRT